MTATQLGRSYHHVGVHYTEWVKKIRLVEPQATNGTSGNKWNLRQQSEQTNCIVRIDDKRH